MMIIGLIGEWNQIIPKVIMPTNAIVRVRSFKNGRLKHAGGRPSKLTPVVSKSICDLIRAGNYLQTACLASGLAQPTFYLWLSKAKEHRAQGIQSPYREFLEDVERAEAYAQVDMLKGIREEPGGNRWLAARRWRKLYGDQVTLTHETKPELTAEQIRALLFGSIKEE